MGLFFPRTRRGWFIRALAVPLVALIAFLIWGGITAHEVASARDALRKAGRPGALDEIKYEAVPPEQNGFDLYNRAGAALKFSSPRSTTNSFGDYPLYSPEWAVSCGESEAQNAVLFTLAHQARGMKVQFRAAPDLEGFLHSGAHAMPVYLMHARSIAQTVGDSAEFAHLFAGDDNLALNRLLDQHCMAQALYGDDTFVSLLVGMGCDAMMCDIAMNIASTLQLKAASGARLPAYASARALIDACMDTDPVLAAGLKRAAGIEPLLWCEVMKRESSKWRFGGPLTDHYMATILESGACIAAAMDAQNVPAANAVFASIPAPSSKIADIVKGGDLAQGISTRTFITRMELRLCATMLAIHLYRADHGALPAKLADLVPSYLPAVPTDLFTADARPIGLTVIKDGLAPGVDRPMLTVEAGPDQGPPYGFVAAWTFTHYSRSASSPRQYRDLLSPFDILKHMPPKPPEVSPLYKLLNGQDPAPATQPGP